MLGGVCQAGVAGEEEAVCGVEGIGGEAGRGWCRRRRSPRSSIGSSRHRASIVTGIDRPDVTMQPDKSGVVGGARVWVVARLLRVLSRKSQRMRHPADA